MTVDELREKFAYNSHRKKLQSDLEQFLERLKTVSCDFRSVVYGSYISKEEAPGDVDVMVDVNLLGGVKDLPVKVIKSLAPEKVDVFITGVGPKIVLKTAEEMVDYFNSAPNNQAKGFKCNHYVELKP